MLKTILFFCTFFFLFILHDIKIFAQQKEDTVAVKAITPADSSGKKIPVADTVVKKKFNPRIAMFRSALIPGWGQVYNKKYWKIPIIYGALGVTAGIFFYNLKYYKLFRKAVQLREDTIPSNDNQVDPSIIFLDTQTLIQYRIEYRQNIDYSVLFFLLFWGLNVVDATVDAHLKGFDVSPDVSMKIRPQFNANTGSPGISFVFFLKDNHHKVLLPLP